MAETPKYNITLGDDDVDALIEALPLASRYGGQYSEQLMDQLNVSGESANRKLALHSTALSQDEWQVIGMSVVIAMGLITGDIQPFIDLLDIQKLAEHKETYERLAPMFEKMLNECLGGSHIDTVS